MLKTAVGDWPFHVNSINSRHYSGPVGQRNPFPEMLLCFVKCLFSVIVFRPLQNISRSWIKHMTGVHAPSYFSSAHPRHLHSTERKSKWLPISHLQLHEYAFFTQSGCIMGKIPCISIMCQQESVYGEKRSNQWCVWFVRHYWLFLSSSTWRSRSAIGALTKWGIIRD